MSNPPANIDFKASLQAALPPGASGPVLNPNSWVLVTVMPLASSFNQEESYIYPFVGYDKDNCPVFETSPDQFVHYNSEPHFHTFKSLDKPPADSVAFNEAERQRVLAAYQAAKVVCEVAPEAPALAEE